MKNPLRLVGAGVWGLLTILLAYGIYQFATAKPVPIRPTYEDELQAQVDRGCSDLFRLNAKLGGGPRPNAILSQPTDVAPELRDLHRDLC